MRPTAKAFVYVMDVETVLRLVGDPNDGTLLPAQQDAFERLRYRAALARAAETGGAVPTKPDAEKRTPTPQQPAQRVRRRAEIHHDWVDLEP